MSRLILVRHSIPAIEPEMLSEDWVLSDTGRGAADQLAKALLPYSPKVVLSGPEPKILETATIIAGRLGLSATPLSGLAEHARRSTKFAEREEFEASIRELFRRSSEVVYGEESGDATFFRFAATVDNAIAENPSDTVIAVSGGTAICLFIAKRQGVEAFSLWRTLRMPMAFVLDRDTWQTQAVY